MLKIRHYILFWVSLSIFYCIFSDDGVPFWDAFFYSKDYVFPIFLINELRGYVVNKQDKALCVVAIIIYLIKFITDVGFVVGLVNITNEIDTIIHVAFMLIILAIFGYDRKTQR